MATVDDDPLPCILNEETFEMPTDTMSAETCKNVVLLLRQVLLITKAVTHPDDDNDGSISVVIAELERETDGFTKPLKSRCFDCKRDDVPLRILMDWDCLVCDNCDWEVEDLDADGDGITNGM